MPRVQGVSALRGPGAASALTPRVNVVPLTNARGTVPLIVDPVVAYTPWCAHNPSPTCTPPRVNISQELFALPDNPLGVDPVWYYRVIVSGTVTAQ